MYFAVDPTSPTLPAQIAQDIAELQAQQEGAPFHVIALVDGAFDEQFFKMPPQVRWPKLSLYTNTPLASLGAAAPQLTTYRSQSRDLEKWLETLFAQCSGKPMLSIIACAVDAEALQRHLLPYLVCQTADTVQWPIRWGDTRVLPGLMEALTDEQRKHLLSPIYSWWSVSRLGSGVKWPGSGETAPSLAEFDKLPMDDARFASLVDLSEPDAILNSIHESQPDLLRERNPAQAHGAVAQHLKVATAHGVDSARARHHFSVLAVMLPDEFVKHPAMIQALNRTRSGAQYFEEIHQLPQDFWQAADASRS